jgi:hypothetical protein
MGSNSHQIVQHWFFFSLTFPHNAQTTRNLFAHLTPVLCKQNYGVVCNSYCNLLYVAVMDNTSRFLYLDVRWLYLDHVMAPYLSSLRTHSNLVWVSNVSIIEYSFSIHIHISSKS